jgi:predicted nucleic acid-binding protein
MINLFPNTLSIFPISPFPRLYLDSCCSSRRYDIITHPVVEQEYQAVWKLQRLIKLHKVNLAWSYVLRLENKRVRDIDQRTEILAWEKYALVSVKKSNEIRAIAHAVQKTGVHKFDALHIACAIKAKCQYFVTTDYKNITTKEYMSAIQLNDSKYYRVHCRCKPRYPINKDTIPRSDILNQVQDDGEGLSTMLWQR